MSEASASLAAAEKSEQTPPAYLELCYEALQACLFAAEGNSVALAGKFYSIFVISLSALGMGQSLLQESLGNNLVSATTSSYVSISRPCLS